jgi:L-ascorbate metabolism protein UlaG (beta-lactamase superfamily)
MSNFGRRPSGARLERIAGSPRYRDGAFHNSAPALPVLRKGSGPAIAEFLWGGQHRTPPAPLPAQSPLPAWAAAPETGLRATWLGHSTVLLELDGARVLTDPVWSERASPFGFAGPRRFQPVPLAIEALPALDAVVISHDHYDHLDRLAVVALARRGVPFITSLGVGAHLEAWGVPAATITELDWWDTAAVGPLRITAAPAQHFSGRRMGDRNATLWSSFAIEGTAHRIFYSGDTGLTPEYQAIRTRLGPFDLVMLEVGAFHPSWGDIHLGPENALTALELLGGGSFLPVHWGTFNLAMHAWDDPAETLLRLAPAKGAHLVMPRLGQPVEPARSESVEPWWRLVGAPPQPEPITAESSPLPAPLPID